MNTKFANLAELRNALREAEELPPARRADMASALASFAKATSRPQESLPTNPISLRPLIAGVTPAMVGHRPGRWRNIISLVTAALAWADIVLIQGRIREPPSAAWLLILPISNTLTLGHAPARHGHLWRFARYCTLVGIEPEAVDDAVLQQFQHDLDHRSLVVETARVARDLSRFWNAAAEVYPAWPQKRLTVANNRNWYALPWETYPESLRADVAAWIDWLSDADPFLERGFKPLRPASVATRRRQLSEYLAAFVHQGGKLENMVDLKSVVTPSQAKLALRFFWDRAGQQRKQHPYLITSMVLAIARHWAKLPAADIIALRAISDRMRPEVTGLTPGNGNLLRQLEDPVLRLKLLELPGTLLAYANKTAQPGSRQALLVETALAIELLLAVPIRIGNLHQLRLGVHLVRGPGGQMQLIIPGEQVKNGVAVVSQLPPEFCRLLDIYVERFRPLIGAKGGDWLFPGIHPGQPKGAEGLRAAIQTATAKWVGIKLNPHIFRHFAALLTLRRNPTAHGVVQRILATNRCSRP